MGDDCRLCEKDLGYETKFDAPQHRDLHDCVTALRAENAKLRAALETIQRATESRIDSVASVAQAAINGNDNVLCRQCEGDPVGSGFIECSLCHETAFVPFDVALDSIDYEISRAYRARAALAGEEVGS